MPATVAGNHLAGLPPPPDPNALRRLLDQRAFRIVYQPVVELKNGKVFAYEALVRCSEPGFENPLVLFQTAVEAGWTGELGRMLREISSQNAPEETLFLNIHPAELNEKWLVQPSDPIYQHSGEVYLEITEGVPLSHFHLCQTILSEVRGRGIHLVVDDLGAGYSNLKYIADLQPRVVKIDRGLVAGLTIDSRLFKLVSSIVMMCRELGASVVAEGIETQEELSAVQASGARFGQGYFLARPAFPLPEVNWPGSIDPSRTQTRRKERPRGGRLRSNTRDPR